MQSKEFFISVITISIVIFLELSCVVADSQGNSLDDVNSMNETNKRAKERAFILLKPDSVQRGLIGRIIERFETKGFKLVALKFIWATRKLAEQHYAEHVDQPFYPQLIQFMTSGPVVPMVWEGLDAIKVTRHMLGKSIQADSMPGTIRGDFSIDRERNVIHGSHSVEAAARETNLWFQENELVPWTPSNSHWINL